jgi:outer membrane protein assembly factor BamB
VTTDCYCQLPLSAGIPRRLKTPKARAKRLLPVRRGAALGLLLVLFAIFLVGCGGAGNPSPADAANASISSISLSPQRAILEPGDTVQFTATVSGTANAPVTWSIDNAVAGSKEQGTITPGGLYTAPSVVPLTGQLIVRATDAQDATKLALAIVTVTSPGEDWPKYRRDLANSGVSGEAGINASNVSNLHLKWKFNAGSAVLASPAVATVGGQRTVYTGSVNGTLYALDAETGAQRWAYQIDQLGPCVTMGCLLDSSPAVEGGVVYFGASNGYVYALDGARGSLLWKTQLGDPNQGYAIYTSPAVYGGLVYVGVASQADAPCVPGAVVALHASSGAVAWNFSTIDQATCPSGVCVGAAVWSSPAIDSQFGTVFVGTGNPGGVCSPPTANATKYPDGILGLDPSTGKFKSYFQAVRANTDTTDVDIGAAPVLHQTQVVNPCTGEDTTSYWLSVPGKNGYVYTGPRGATGLLANPSATSLSPAGIIAASIAVPAIQFQSCGQGNLQQLAAANDIITLSGGGYMFDIHQSSDGKTNQTWRTTLPACKTFAMCGEWSSPAAINNLLFFGLSDYGLHAATTDGNLVWRFGTQGPVISSPAISHSSVYFGSFDGFVYCLSF